MHNKFIIKIKLLTDVYLYQLSYNVKYYTFYIANEQIVFAWKGDMFMKLVRQLSIITAICFSGELIKSLFKLTIPGNVIGMILLLIFLCFGIIKVEMIEDVSKFLLDHLPFFFVPAGVGLIASVSTIKNCWQYIILIIFISTIVVMAVTGVTIQLIKRRWLK